MARVCCTVMEVSVRMVTRVDNAVAHSTAERIYSQPRLQGAAVGRGGLSLWKSFALMYRLFVRARETSLRVEGAPRQRRSEIARYCWLGN